VVKTQYDTYEIKLKKKKKKKKKKGLGDKFRVGRFKKGGWEIKKRGLGLIL